MLTDSVAAKGHLQVLKYNEFGQLAEQRSIPNLIVAVGKSVIASRLVGNTIAVFSHMAVGSSNTAVTTSQTSLGTELGRVTLDSTTRTNNTVVYIATFPAGTGTGTLSEAGIFNNSSSGDMLCRTNFNGVVKGVGDTVVITWNVTIT